MFGGFQWAIIIGLIVIIGKRKCINYSRLIANFILHLRPFVFLHPCTFLHPPLSHCIVQITLRNTLRGSESVDSQCVSINWYSQIYIYIYIKFYSSLSSTLHLTTNSHHIFHYKLLIIPRPSLVYQVSQLSWKCTCLCWLSLAGEGTSTEQDHTIWSKHQNSKWCNCFVSCCFEGEE